MDDLGCQKDRDPESGLGSEGRTESETVGRGGIAPLMKRGRGHGDGTLFCGEPDTIRGGRSTVRRGTDTV